MICFEKEITIVSFYDVDPLFRFLVEVEITRACFEALNDTMNQNTDSYRY